jgi:tetrahydromethanopterin S-methyltransferase subunit F
VEAVGNLGSSADSARLEATASAKRIAPIAIAAAGALVLVGVLRKLR